MANIKPIETIYNGYRFRSRLEARWAVFFDTLGVPYEYEPEGFDLGNGEYYLPDFRLKCYGSRTGYPLEKCFDLWIEVKGDMTESDAKRIIKFTNRENDPDGFPKNSVLIISEIPKDSRDMCYLFGDEKFSEYDTPVFNYYNIDGDWFGAYPTGINGKFFLMGADGNYMSNEAIRQTDKACAKARQARFEHGETPY